MGFLCWQCPPTEAAAEETDEAEEARRDKTPEAGNKEAKENAGACGTYGKSLKPREAAGTAVRRIQRDPKPTPQGVVAEGFRL